MTATVEDLNLLDVVRADRITARLSVHHPAEGYIPEVTLIGSSIENLRIGGERVQTPVNLRLLDAGEEAPDTDWPEKPALLRIALEQSRKIADSPNLPESLCRRYAWVGSDKDRARKGYVLCSAAEDVKGWVPDLTYGHILVIPGFGVLFLVELIVSSAAFTLTMLRAELNGPVHGTVGVASAHINGRPMP